MESLTSTMPRESSDLLQALVFAEQQFASRSEEGLLSAEQKHSLNEYYAERRESVLGGQLPADTTLRSTENCWSCREPIDRLHKACAACGAPAQTEDVLLLRHLIFVAHEIKKHEKQNRLNLASAHQCLAQVNERIVALRCKLDKQRIPLAEAVAELSSKPVEDAKPEPLAQEERRSAVAPTKTALPRRHLLEILLDPRSIQWLLSSGGALLVLGLIIWLAAEGIFQNKLVVAVIMGVGNAALLVAGWGVIRYTRYETAGRALTLLACLVMPLNLWFYNAQGLIVLKAGGYLWLPALLCCALYAISARVLRDATFVYVFVGGIALTGLLILADRTFNKFWEISAPATLLVVLGLLALHAERIFSEGDGPFTRRRFGMAFFWSGHVLLAAGLLLVLGAQLCGGLMFSSFAAIYRSYDFGQPDIVTTLSGKLCALFLVLAGTYAYAYADLVVRRVGVFIYVAVATLLWAEILVINLIPWSVPHLEVLIIALALTALLANLTLASLAGKESSLLRFGPALGLALCVLPVVLGVMLHFRATTTIFPDWHVTLNASYVVAMLVTALSCRVGAYLYRKELPSLSMTYFFGTAATTLAGAAGLLLVLSPSIRWEEQAPLLMVIPLAYLIASRLYRGHTPAKPLVWVAHVAIVVMLVASLGTAFKGFLEIEGERLNLLLAAFFAEAALFYALEAIWRKHEASIYVCTIMAAAAVWQLLKYYGIADEYYTVAFALIGLLLLVAYRFAVLEKFGRMQLARAAFQCGNALLSLAFVGGALMVLSELAGDRASKGVLVPLLFLLMGMSLVAVFLVHQADWRRWYVATTIVNAGLIVLVLAVLGTLTTGQKVEILSLTTGVLLLISGHLGWYREQNGHNDLVSLSLFLGGALVAVPLTAVVLSYRFSNPDFSTFHTINEVGMLVIGLLLLATGFMFQIKSTTLTGAFLMAVYLVSLLLFIRLPEKLQTTAVYIMIGGGVFFGCGILLSIYRDRLLTLPEKIKRREGIFRILTWR